MERGYRKVLFVSDDPAGGPLWADLLRGLGAEVTLAAALGEALGRWEEDVPDITVIDDLNGLDEVDVCRTLRARGVNPILFLATLPDESYILNMYQAGADECIPRSIGAREFAARLTAWCRHQGTLRAEALPSLEVAGLRLEPGRRQVVTPDGTPVGLKTLELRLLHLLMSCPGQPLSPEELADRIWGSADGGSPRGVRHLVGHLRRKIEPDPRRPRYLCTVPRRGYAFCAGKTLLDGYAQEVEGRETET